MKDKNYIKKKEVIKIANELIDNPYIQSVDDFINTLKKRIKDE